MKLEELRLTENSDIGKPYSKDFHVVLIVNDSEGNTVHWEVKGLYRSYAEASWNADRLREESPFDDSCDREFLISAPYSFVATYNAKIEAAKKAIAAVHDMVDVTPF